MYLNRNFFAIQKRVKTVIMGVKLVAYYFLLSLLKGCVNLEGIK
ncbi:hypothetical protein T190607A02C_40096 [Tenacibaculum sp. 190524A02b]